jgi:DMSO/TMAO reductase YedYZ molybdopterin-dependent catalytic subunit
MIAYGMNCEQQPLGNGFPLRLVVPGRYATYWVNMLNDIEVLDEARTTGQKSLTPFPTRRTPASSRAKRT